MLNIMKYISRENMTNSIKRCFSLYLHKYKTMFFVLLVGAGVAGASFWYYSLYYFHWTEDRKVHFRNEKSKNTVLNVTEFNRVIQNLDERESVYTSKKDRVDSFFAEPIEDTPR